MKKNLKKKIAVVTGGAGFFGEQICEALLEINYKVVVIDINNNKLKNIKRKFNKKKHNIDIVNEDITNEEKINSKALSIINKFKKIDLLVNNAAIDYKPIIKNKKKQTFGNTHLEAWSRELNVGLTGAFICSKIFSNFMIKKRRGIILNIASDLSVIAPDQRLYSHLGFHKPASYSAIKHGLVGLTKYLASTLAKYSIRANAISPGGIMNNQDKLFQKKIKKLIPMGRMAKRNEYKGAIQFLCSDKSSYMTGHNLVIDGGRSIL